jgi:hypothetical protein
MADRLFHLPGESSFVHDGGKARNLRNMMCRLMWPWTKQNSGNPGLAAPAGTIRAASITVLGTGKPEAGNVTRLAHGVGVTGVATDVVVVLKPVDWRGPPAKAGSPYARRRAFLHFG